MARPWNDRYHDEQNDARYHDELRLLADWDQRPCKDHHSDAESCAHCDPLRDAMYNDELRLLETEMKLIEVAIRAGLILNETMARVWERERAPMSGSTWCHECDCRTNHDGAQHRAAENATENQEP